VWYKLPWQDRLVRVPVGRYPSRSHNDGFIVTMIILSLIVKTELGA
jgi:hypothetical protein